MLDFQRRKAFWLYYDNMGKFTISNVPVVVIIGSLTLLANFWQNALALPVSLAVGYLLLVIYQAGLVSFLRSFTAYQPLNIKQLPALVLAKLKTSVLFAALMLFIQFVLFNAAYFYAAMAGSGLLFIVIVGLTSYLMIINLAITLIFFTVQDYFKCSFAVALKKSALIVVHNFFAFLAMLIQAFLLLMLSFATVFVLFGITNITLFFVVGTESLILKYEYLNKNINVNKKDLWPLVLADEEQKLEGRSLKSVFMPWRD